jgi:hypothetical protein
MKKIHVSTDRVLLILIVLLLWYTTLLQACESDTEIDLQPTLSVVDEKIVTGKLNDHGIHRRFRFKN